MCKTREAQKKLQLRKTANNEKSHKKAAESGVGVWGTGPPQKKRAKRHKDLH